jgi:hypothetical protein
MITITIRETQGCITKKIKNTGVVLYENNSICTTSLFFFVIPPSVFPIGIFIMYHLVPTPEFFLSTPDDSFYCAKYTEFFLVSSIERSDGSR